MLSVPAPSFPTPERQIYTNRTLNLRAIRAIGYDMDYTLIHYRVEAWERAAYLHIKNKLLQAGWPIEGLSFVPSLVIRGLVFDTELGNIVKTNRFGYVKRAIHGTRPLEYEEQRQVYAREIVDLAQDRYVFMNTLFSLSEGCLYAQLVDLLDQRLLPGVMGYRDLYKRVRTSIDEAHFEGFLKAEIMGAPSTFVEHDPETAAALLDSEKAVGEKAPPHHQLRLGVHQRDDGLRLRAVAAPRDEVARPLRRGRRPRRRSSCRRRPDPLRWQN